MERLLKIAINLDRVSQPTALALATMYEEASLVSVFGMPVLKIGDRRVIVDNISIIAELLAIDTEFEQLVNSKENEPDAAVANELVMGLCKPIKFNPDPDKIYQLQNLVAFKPVASTLRGKYVSSGVLFETPGYRMERHYGQVYDDELVILGGE